MKPLNRHQQITRLVTLLAALLAMAGCKDDKDNVDTTPEIGDTFFISADENGDDSRTGVDDAMLDTASGDMALDADMDVDAAVVEEGDIYSVLGNGRLLNLNQYRGLQVLDFSDMTNPEVIGRFPISGSPVEMYVQDNLAIVLFNDYRGYYGNRDDIDVTGYMGGMAAVVDISKPETPTLAAMLPIEGYIIKSRLVTDGNHTAVYVAAGQWTEQGGVANLTSFALEADGTLTPQSTIDLGGNVADIQATPAALMVARTDWNQASVTSRVALIDIADPTGTMTMGADIPISGVVRKKTDMSLEGHILRVVSSNDWGTSNDVNHLETFDVTDLQNPVAIDHATFGAKEELYASLFLADRGFFVTYRNTDPFHAFSINDDGTVEEVSQYIISGWNDFFKPIFGGTRIIGVGIDTDNNRSLAVSLYDTALDNTAPFITRATGDLSFASSEANWDDRAFTVLENAVDVTAPDGTAETGLILLPYKGWIEPTADNPAGMEAGVQIFTFSDTTVTARGKMSHDSQVRRSILAQPETVANLSETTARFFDAADPDAPVQKGEVALAPDYSDFLVFGKWGVRKVGGNSAYYWGSNQSPATLEVVSLSAHPDTATPVASVSIDGGAQLLQKGNLLIAVSHIWPSEFNPDVTKEATHIVVFDMSDPTNPDQVSDLNVPELPISYGVSFLNGCWGDGCGYYASRGVQVVGNALVFNGTVSRKQKIGEVKWCETTPVNWELCDDNGCVYQDAYKYCETLPSGQEICEEYGQQCSGDGYDNCKDVSIDDMDTTTTCGTEERYRYWESYQFRIVDISNPAKPTLRSSVTMPADEEAASLHVEGDNLYITYTKPYTVKYSDKPWVQYFFKVANFDDPSDPVLTKGINIPGQILEVNGDTLYTRDVTWSDNQLDSSLNRVVVKDGKATLKGRRIFKDEMLHAIVINGDNAYVTHSEQGVDYYGYATDVMLVDMVADMAAPSMAPGVGYYYFPYYAPLDEEDKTKFSTLTLDGDNLPISNTFEVDAYATLKAFQQNKAVFQVPGGLLVVNMTTPDAPYAQAFYPVTGNYGEIISAEDKIIVPCGRFGIHRFDLDIHNLL